MKKIVHVIPHTHWDREWYFTTSRSKVYLMKDLHDVIENLEHNPGYDRFVLDGQVSLVEDYLNWRPQDADRIRKLVKNHKLILGPWYTQTDQYVISGESIVRNLQYGMAISQKYGGYQKVGYVPDSFGQEVSLPQIYQQFGITDTMFWRGVSDEDVPDNEYLWQGLDGSIVNVYQIPCGYYVGGVIDESKLAGLMEHDPLDKITNRSTTNHLALPSGFDQAPPRTDLPQVVEKLNKLNSDYHFEISSIEEYIAAVKKAKPQLVTLQGELTNGKNMRIHKTIYSSRSDLKKLNTQLQYYLVNVTEPVLTIGDQFGLEYPQATMDDLWKAMFENAAHDSIGSCVSDTTNEDVYFRYKQIRDIATNLVELTLRQIAVRIKKLDEYPITLTAFNSLPVSRTIVVEQEFYSPSKSFRIVDENRQPLPCSVAEIKDVTDYILGQTIQLDPSKKIYRPEHVYQVKAYIEVSDIPAMGYKQLYLDPDHQQVTYLEDGKSQSDLENEFYKITINENGSFDILDKTTNRLYQKQGILVENGDEGDSFNYSPAKKDLLVYSTDQENSVTIQKTPTIDVAKIHYDFKAPRTLHDRANQRLNAIMPVDVILKLAKGAQVIEFEVKTDNRNVNDHRLCIDFDTQIASKFSFADVQFGTIKRPVERSETLKLWQEHPEQWNEKPIAIETCQSFVALANDQRTFAVLPQGVREYEIIGDDYSVIQLTLFRTYGMMGKEDLIYRPGRASGEKVVATPNAQLHQKNLTFKFGVKITNQMFNGKEIAWSAKAFDTPIQLYEYAEFLNGRLIFCLEEVPRDLPPQYQFLSTPKKLVLSTLKKALNRSGYVARFYNADIATSLSDEIKFTKKPQKVELVDLKEDSIKALALKDKVIQLENVPPAKIVSIYFEF